MSVIVCGVRLGAQDYTFTTVESRSQDAFRDLVGRHRPMVYSAARRIVRDPQLAEEVAQGVFTTLARKAESIRPSHAVGGWLYNTTRHLARSHHSGLGWGWSRNRVPRCPLAGFPNETHDRPCRGRARRSGHFPCAPFAVPGGSRCVF